MMSQENKDETIQPASVAVKPEVAAPAAADIRPEVIEDTQRQGALTKSVSLAQALTISLLASGLSGYLAYAAASNNVPAAPQVAIVDANYLMMAKVGDLASQPSSTAAQVANQFIGELSQVMKYYADHGILVINATDALNKPEGVDITKQVAQSMNIRPAPAVVPPAPAAAPAPN